MKTREDGMPRRKEIPMLTKETNFSSYKLKYTKTVCPPTWEATCLMERGRILNGPDAHWCMDWDELPVDASTPEYNCCTCFKKTLKGRIYNWFFMRWFNFQEWKVRRKAPNLL